MRKKIFHQLPLKIKDSFLFKKLNHLVTNHAVIIFILILIIGLYLRFYHINETISFGWDQGRDAWMIRDIIQGKLTLIGPRTGVGHMHIGPVYYYLLAPFFYFMNLDPSAANYLNIITNILNFVLIFIVTKKIFNNYAALFVTFVYAVSHYLITTNQVPWNVTLMPGVAALIFYSIVKIYEGSYRWVFVLWTLSGFYFNLHFTAIFLPVINILSLLFVKDKKKTLLYSLLSIPLYVVWFIPNIIYSLTSGGETGLFKDFFQYYYIGFHFRFLLHRLPDALIQFSMILYNPLLKYLQFVLPSIFIVLLFFEKDKQKRLLGYLISVWFIVPLIGFTVYGGSLSEYYLLYTVPMVLYIIVYLQEKILKFTLIPSLLVLLLFWSFYTYQNTKDLWIKPSYGGLTAQKESVKRSIKNGEKIDYNEGDIKAYLYTIWTSDGKRF